MKISKKDALMWFEFFASLPEYEELLTSHYEIIYSVFALQAEHIMWDLTIIFQTDAVRASWVPDLQP